MKKDFSHVASESKKTNTFAAPPFSTVIRQAGSRDQEQWDAYVLGHPGAAPYHLFAWKQAVESSYGHHCYYLYAEREGRVAGVLPLVHLRLPGLVNELVALPYCDVGNCLADSEEVQDDLVGEALRIKKKLQAKKLQLRGPLKETDLTGDALKKEKTGKVRMLLSLPASSDKLFSGFKSKLRSQVRKAEKNGVVFRWGGLQELDAVYSVFANNMHHLGSPVHAKKWLRAVLVHYDQRARVGLTEFEGKIVGMGIILLGGHSVSIPWASTLRQYNHLGPNMLLYWNLLKYSADNGFQVFDFGRASEGEGTYRFKKQWGAQPEPLPWYSCPCAGGRVDSPDKGPLVHKREMVARIWQKTPLSVANMLGPCLRKYISL